jgi:hypothetical protein
LAETWRLHPDICAFTSELFYEGKLRSRDGLEMMCVKDGAPLTGTNSKRARSLGFPIKQIDELLRLWLDKQRSSRKVCALATLHRQSVVDRMNAHRSIVKVLTRLIAACKGDDRPIARS